MHNRPSTSSLLLFVFVSLSLAFVQPTAFQPPACEVFVPNVFSPNDDGVNDQFVPAFGCPVMEYELAVYNRWGKQIYLSSDPNTGWDGRVGGDLQSPDVYVYCLQYSMSGDTSRQQIQRLVGDVMLLR